LFNGTVSGGLGSVLGGGNFWMGAGQGLIVTAFNFLAHKEITTVEENKTDGDCPTCPKNAKNWQTYTEDYSIFDKKFWTWDNLSNGQKSYYYFNGEWNEITPAMGDVPLGPAGTGKGISKIIKAIHGNSLKSLKPTWGYKLFTLDGKFLKNGITSKPLPEMRYTKAFMKDKVMKETKLFKNRLEAWKWEFKQNQIKRGPWNKNMH